MEKVDIHRKLMISITHVVSPSKFYFRELDDGLMDTKVKAVEQKLKEQVEGGQNYYHKRHEFYEPKVNDIVAYFDELNQKWIRCTVDDFCIYYNNQPTVQLWSIDYGFPFQIILPDRKLRKVSDEFRLEARFIGLGSLDILPGELRFQAKQTDKALWCKDWRQFALKEFIKPLEPLKENNEIYFEPKFRNTTHTHCVFGDLSFGSRQKSICEHFLSRDCAVKPETLEEFAEKFRQMEAFTSKSRTGKLLFDTHQYGIPDWRSRRITQKSDVLLHPELPKIDENIEAIHPVDLTKARVFDWLSKMQPEDHTSVLDDTEHYFSCDESVGESDIMSSVSHLPAPPGNYIFE